MLRVAVRHQIPAQSKGPMIVDYIPASVDPDVLICAIHAGVEHGSGDVTRAIHAFCRGVRGSMFATTKIM